MSALLFFGCNPLRAAAIEDQGVWTYVSITGPLLDGGPESSRWRFLFDSPNRFGNNARQYAQGAWRTALGYNLNRRWCVWAGYVYTQTDTPYARVPYGEHRLYQQLSWSGQYGKFTLSSRQRLEQKFPDTGHDMGLRVRQQFRLSHPIPAIAPLSWVLTEEIFFNLNRTDYGARRTLDQNRAFAGFGWQWSAITRSEIGYLHHFTNRPGGPDRINHVLAISLGLSFR